MAYCMWHDSHALESCICPVRSEDITVFRKRNKGNVNENNQCINRNKSDMDSITGIVVAWADEYEDKNGFVHEAVKSLWQIVDHVVVVLAQRSKSTMTTSSWFSLILGNRNTEFSKRKKDTDIEGCEVVLEIDVSECSQLSYFGDQIMPLPDNTLYMMGLDIISSDMVLLMPYGVKLEVNKNKDDIKYDLLYELQKRNDKKSDKPKALIFPMEYSSSPTLTSCSRDQPYWLFHSQNKDDNTKDRRRMKGGEMQRDPTGMDLEPTSFFAQDQSLLEDIAVAHPVAFSRSANVHGFHYVMPFLIDWIP